MKRKHVQKYCIGVLKLHNSILNSIHQQFSMFLTYASLVCLLCCHIDRPNKTAQIFVSRNQMCQKVTWDRIKHEEHCFHLVVCKVGYVSRKDELTVCSPKDIVLNFHGVGFLPEWLPTKLYDCKSHTFYCLSMHRIIQMVRVGVAENVLDDLKSSGPKR